jgi:HEAT repeat protein
MNDLQSALQNWEDKFRQDPRSDEQIITLALSKDPDADAESEEYWLTIGLLQHRFPEILPRVGDLLRCEDQKSREAAAYILGQSRCSAKWDARQCAGLLAAAASHEKAPRPLAAMLHAMGHLHDESVIPTSVAFRQHEDSEVRLAVTHTLSQFENPEAIQALIELSADSNYDVRNWATFNLGSMIDTDTPAIRDALAARLHETECEALGEAIVGLARRGDVRLLPPLMDLFDTLDRDDLRSWIIMMEVIDELAERTVAKSEQVWLPALRRAEQIGFGDREELRKALLAYPPTPNLTP